MAVVFDSESESKAVDRGLEMVGSIDQKHGVSDVVFVLQFTKKFDGESGIIGRIQPEKEKFVRHRIDHGTARTGHRCS